MVKNYVYTMARVIFSIWDICFMVRWTMPWSLHSLLFWP